MCGSQGIYDQILQDGCSIQLLTNGVVKKIFDTITTTVTESTAGNLKLISSYPDQIVILSDTDLLGMGYASRAAFMTFYNGVRSSCSGGGPVTPITPQLVAVTFPDNIDNGQTLVQTGVATGVVLGGNYTVIPVTDLAPLYAGGLIVSFDIVTNGLLTVTVKNLGDDDDVVIPTLSFNIYSL